MLHDNFVIIDNNVYLRYVFQYFSSKLVVVVAVMMMMVVVVVLA